MTNLSGASVQMLTQPIMLVYQFLLWTVVSKTIVHSLWSYLGELAQFRLYVHKGGLKPHSFHFTLANAMLRNFYNKFLVLWGASVTQR